jgi:hypothetical protein
MSRLMSAATVVSSVAGTAVAQNVGGTLTDGRASYQLGPAPTYGLATNPAASSGAEIPQSRLVVDGQSSPANQLSQDWWWYRAGGATRELNLANGDGSVGGSFGNNGAAYSYTLQTASTAVLGASLSYTLTGGTNAAQVQQQLNITNSNPFPVTLAVFHYLDLDLGGSPGGDSATLIAANRIRQTNGQTFADFFAPSANAYRVAQYPLVLNDLTDNVANGWTNTGLPFLGPGNVTASFEWDLTIQPMSSVSVADDYAVTTPAPATGALLAAGCALCLRHRRRSA